MTRPLSFDSTYIHLRPDGSAASMAGGAAFWAGLANRRDLESGRLMGSIRQSADWNHWERHPAGDEILVLLSGEMELALDTTVGEQRAKLKPGQTVIVPKGIWHRGIVMEPGDLMFITPGAGCRKHESCPG